MREAAVVKLLLVHYVASTYVAIRRPRNFSVVFFLSSLDLGAPTDCAKYIAVSYGG